MTMTAAIMTRAALFRPAPGPPDFYQFGSCNHIGRGCRLCRCFSGGLILRRFTCCSFDRIRRLRHDFNRFGFN